MTLATRCPACGTVFRVVPDQLKVSDGWVRCGRCAEVFDASGALIDLDAPGSAIVAPPPNPAGPAAVRAHAPAPAANDEAAPPADGREGAAPVASTAARPAAEAPLPGHEALPPGPEAEGTAPEALGPAGAATPAAASSAAPPPARPATAVEAPADTVVAAAAGGDAETPVPGFVRRAERADRWRSPRRRAALAALALVLAATLVAQVGVHYRDRVAATWPATRPALLAACAAIGCRVDAPRRIEALSVESSALLRVEGTPLHRLQVVVRNRAATEVRMPAVELSLTDTIGRTLARRVFDARELGVAAPSLPPQGETTLAGMLELDEVKVAGYTVELFYP